MISSWDENPSLEFPDSKIIEYISFGRPAYGWLLKVEDSGALIQKANGRQIYIPNSAVTHVFPATSNPPSSWDPIPQKDQFVIARVEPPRPPPVTENVIPHRQRPHDQKGLNHRLFPMNPGIEDLGFSQLYHQAQDLERQITLPQVKSLYRFFNHRTSSDTTNILSSYTSHESISPKPDPIEAENEFPFTNLEAAIVLFKTEKPSPTQIYAANRILFHYSHLYFRPLGNKKFKTRAPSKVLAIKQELDLLSDENFMKSVVETLSKFLDSNSTQQQTWKPTDPREIQIASLMSRFALTQSKTELIDPSGKIFNKLLKPLGTWEYEPEDMHRFLRSLQILPMGENYHKLRSQLNDEILRPFASDYAPKIQVEEKEDLNRQIFQDETIWAIDDPSTKEVDDGISMTSDGWIHVHIADPTSFMSPHSPLDLMARSRGSSVYLPEMTHPMFPSILAHNDFSIRENSKNFTLTFSVKLNQMAQVENFKISRSISKNVRRISYDHVNLVLKGKIPSNLKISENDAKILRKFEEISKLRETLRNTQGAIQVSFPFPEVKLKDGKIVISYKDQNTPSHKLVAEMMILAGEVAAKYCVEHQIPVPFRSQKFSEKLQRELESLKSTRFSEQVQNWKMIMNMARASNIAHPLPHVGIGLSAYTRVTSPIRRYPDILSHFQLKAHLNSRDLPFNLNEMSDVIQSVSYLEEEIRTLQKKSTEFWMKQYISQQGQANYQGIVVDCEKKSTGLSAHYRINAWLDIGISAVLKSSTDIPLGTQVEVSPSRLSNLDLEFELRSISPSATLPDAMVELDADGYAKEWVKKLKF